MKTLFMLSLAAAISSGAPPRHASVDGIPRQLAQATNRRSTRNPPPPRASLNRPFDLNALVAALPKGRPANLRLPAGRYVIRDTIDLRNRHGLTITGEAGTDIAAEFTRQSKGRPMLDLAGSFDVTLRDLSFSVAGEWLPSCAILGARAVPNTSSNFFLGDNVSIVGRFEKAAVVWVAGECATWRRCKFWNLQPGGNGFLLLSDNAHSVFTVDSDEPRRDGDKIASLPAATSPVGPICGGSMLQTSFFDCIWSTASSTGTEIGMWIEARNFILGNVNLIGGGFACESGSHAARAKGGFAGLALIAHTGLANVVIQGIRFESQGARYAVYGWSAPGCNVVDVTLTNNTLYGLEEPIRLTGNVFGDWTVRNNESLAWAEYDWPVAAGSPNRDPARRAVMRVSDIRNFQLDLSNGMVKTGADGSPRVFASKALIVDGGCYGSTVRVGDLDHVVLPDNPNSTLGTTLVSTDENATHASVVRRLSGVREDPAK